MAAATLNWRKVTNDLVFAVGANLFHKVISYVVVVLLARHLHKDDIGAFFLAASLAAIASLISELGTTRYLTREIAAAPERAPDALGEVLTLRLPVMTFAYVVLNVGVSAFYREIWLAVSLSGLYVFLQSLFLSFSAVFLGVRKVKYRALVDVASQVILIALVWIAVQTQVGLVGILGCYIVANLALVAMAAFLLVARVGAPRIARDISTCIRVLRGSLPFFVLIALSVLHFKIDTVMLGLMTTLEAVARYEIAYKFLEVSRFVVRPLSMIFLPICTGLVIQQLWSDLRTLVRRLLLWTAVVAVGLGVGVAACAGAIIDLVFGAEFASSVPIMQALFVSLPAVYLVFVGTVLANALYLEKKLIRVTCICLIVNVVANLYVIPRWGALGAAWTTVATEALLALLIGVLLARRLRRMSDSEQPPRKGKDATNQIAQESDALP